VPIPWPDDIDDGHEEDFKAFQKQLERSPVSVQELLERAGELRKEAVEAELRGYRLAAAELAGQYEAEAAARTASVRPSGIG
jgi:hypothetical protein